MQYAIPSIVPNDIDKYVTHYYADNNGVKIHWGVVRNAFRTFGTLLQQSQTPWETLSGIEVSLRDSSTISYLFSPGFMGSIGWMTPDSTNEKTASSTSFFV